MLHPSAHISVVEAAFASVGGALLLRAEVSLSPNLNLGHQLLCRWAGLSEVAVQNWLQRRRGVAALVVV